MRIALLALALLAAGCGREERATKTELQTLGLAYHNLNATDNGPPKGLEEFRAAFKPGATVLRRVESGEFVVRWGLRIPKDFPDGTAHTALIYHKDVPTKGGPVAMGDGSYRWMTAEEFRASPLPATKP